MAAWPAAIGKCIQTWPQLAFPMGRQQPLLRVQDDVPPADIKPANHEAYKRTFYVFQGKCKIANFPGAIHEQGGTPLKLISLNFLALRCYCFGDSKHYTSKLAREWELARNLRPSLLGQSQLRAERSHAYIAGQSLCNATHMPVSGPTRSSREDPMRSCPSPDSALVTASDSSKLVDGDGWSGWCFTLQATGNVAGSAPPR